MAFHPLRPLSARWRPVDAAGLEHLDLRPIDDGGIAVESVVIGGRGAVPYGCRYRLVLDRDWAVRRLDLETTEGRTLRLRADGRGVWTDGDGGRIAALDGCIDIDLAGSPFTNTLPIRRDWLAAGGAAHSFRMAYVPFDTFTPVVDGQTYRCLKEDRLYRYEAADRSFTADLTVDDDGLVTDYPGLFARLDN
jgi:uncharacterized protein